MQNIEIHMLGLAFFALPSYALFHLGRNIWLILSSNSLLQSY